MKSSSGTGAGAGAGGSSSSSSRRSKVVARSHKVVMAKSTICDWLALGGCPTSLNGSMSLSHKVFLNAMTVSDQGLGFRLVLAWDLMVKSSDLLREV